MIPAVVLALSLMTTTFALPVTPGEQVTPGVEGVPQTQAEVQVIQQVEKTGVQGSTQVDRPVQQVVQQNVPVPKVENVPLDVQNVRPTYTENPVLLPIQSSSVVPVNTVGQVPRPVIVPAEAITAGRVIIMAPEPIQQRSYQDVAANAENQVPYQQVVQPVTYTQGSEPQQQSYHTQPTENQTPYQHEVQQVQPNQEQLKEQPVPVRPVVNYNPVPQVYTVQQNVQQDDSVEKQVPYQTPVLTPNVQQQQIQNQEPYRQASQVQNQEVETEYQQVYNGRPIVVENVEKQGSQVQQSVVQQQQHHQVSTYSQNQQVEPVYNVQPVGQQVQNVQPVPVEKQGYNHIETQSVEYQQQKVQSVQQAVEKYVPHQQPQQTGEYVPVQNQPVYQQQVYNADVAQVENPVPYQTAAQVQEQLTKTAEVEQLPNHQAENHVGQPPHNYGDKLQVQHSNPTLTQNYSAEQSSVVYS